ncbi:Arylsulfatase A [Kriegella aquimaris]|uniref:Arylsulfatase A n=2 Tax=Kriegella aquimaris TaxID=192904 RepID=A0A1G9KKI4_9FLAO|nr:Arylsulfatase A [Kriegella aquimaris]
MLLLSPRVSDVEIHLKTTLTSTKMSTMKVSLFFKKRALLIFLSLFCLGLKAQGNKKPNIVFILVDDLGWMDISVNGSTFYETPNIDQLAEEGIRFTQAYAASPICSPTRASILTGKNPARINLTQWIGGPGNPDYLRNLPLEEVLFPELLQDAGYKTAFMGKWHLNNVAGEETFWPDKQGFDVNVAGHFRGGLYIKNKYFSPWNIPNLENGPEGEYMTDRLANEAVKFIDKNASAPFLLYFSLYSVHAPFDAPTNRIAKYEKKKEVLALTDEDRFAEETNAEKPFTYRKKQDHPTYAAMVESMDMAVGKILGELNDKGIADNTVVIFFSDNGGLSTSEGIPTANSPLRAGKGWLYEGGIREPAIIKWPGTIKPGMVSDATITSMDFYPTILEMTGQPLRPDLHIDGRSLVPLLKGETNKLHEVTYYHYPHHSNQKGSPSSAIRDGDYKLIVFLNENRFELYNLKNDIGERHNLAPKLPELTNHLYKKLYEWWEEVDAKFPKEFIKKAPQS